MIYSHTIKRSSSLIDFFCKEIISISLRIFILMGRICNSKFIPSIIALDIGNITTKHKHY